MITFTELRGDDVELLTDRLADDADGAARITLELERWWELVRTNPCRHGWTIEHHGAVIGHLDAEHDTQRDTEHDTERAVDQNAGPERVQAPALGPTRSVAWSPWTCWVPVRPAAGAWPVRTFTRLGRCPSSPAFGVRRRVADLKQVSRRSPARRPGWRWCSRPGRSRSEPSS